MIKNKYISLIFKTVIAIGCILGIILDIFVKEGSVPTTMLCFFTIQSNILCAVAIIMSIYYDVKDIKGNSSSYENKYFTMFKSSVTFSIIVTLLIYHFLLNGSSFTMGSSPRVNELCNFLLHYFTPIMMILDWLLFDKKGKLKLYYPLIWLIYPVIYMVFTYIRAFFGPPIFPSKSGTLHPYPYFFLDVSVLGVDGVIKWVVPLIILFLALGYVIVGFDKLSARSKTKINKCFESL